MLFPRANLLTDLANVIFFRNAAPHAPCSMMHPAVSNPAARRPKGKTIIIVPKNSTMAKRSDLLLSSRGGDKRTMTSATADFSHAISPGRPYLS